MKKLILALSVVLVSFVTANDIEDRSAKYNILREHWMSGSRQDYSCGYSNNIDDIFCRLRKYTVVRD